MDFFSLHLILKLYTIFSAVRFRWKRSIPHPFSGIVTPAFLVSSLANSYYNKEHLIISFFMERLIAVSLLHSFFKSYLLQRYICPQEFYKLHPIIFMNEKIYDSTHKNLWCCTIANPFSILLTWSNKCFEQQVSVQVSTLWKPSSRSRNKCGSDGQFR